MAVMGDEPHNRRRPRRAQTIDEAIELSPIFVSAEADLLVLKGFGGQHGEPRQIEAEARIDLVAERGQPLDSARIACGSRMGREVPAAMRLTVPSVRKSASSRRRAPTPRAASAVLSRAASRSMVASTSSSRAIGS